MTNQTNNSAVAAGENYVAMNVEQEQKAVSGSSKTFCRALFRNNTIAQGMVWHEILSGPLCKRRRNK
ncbi:MAG: hypothetical protein IJW63_08245 [Lachnospiraceae bacterium]|nr:hypothetical protein [Lachnospiraceae bacterium]